MQTCIVVSKKYKNYYFPTYNILLAVTILSEDLNVQIFHSSVHDNSNNCLYPGSDHTSFHLYKSNEPLPIFFFRLDRKGEEDRLPLFHLSLPPAGGAEATPPGGGLLGPPTSATPTTGMPFREKGGILHRLSFSLGYGTFFKEGQVRFWQRNIYFCIIFFNVLVSSIS